MSKLSVRDLDLKGKRVFVRVDFNVPLKDGRISDDTRIQASLPTIQLALKQGATVVLASHLGRPKGKVNPQMSLRPVADRLADLVDLPVTFTNDWPALFNKSSCGRTEAKEGLPIPRYMSRYPSLSASPKFAAMGMNTLSRPTSALTSRNVPFRRFLYSLDVSAFRGIPR